MKIRNGSAQKVDAAAVQHGKLLHELLHELLHDVTLCHLLHDDLDLSLTSEFQDVENVHVALFDRGIGLERPLGTCVLLATECSNVAEQVATGSDSTVGCELRHDSVRRSVHGGLSSQRLPIQNLEEVARRLSQRAKCPDMHNVEPRSTTMQVYLCAVVDS